MFRKKEDYILNTFVIVRVLSLILLSLTWWTQQSGGKCTTLHQKKISELLDIKKKKNGARLQVTDVISLVCMSSLGWGGVGGRYFIRTVDVTEFEIKAAKSLPSLWHFNIIPLIFTVSPAGVQK